MSDLQVKAIFAGLFFGVWPLIMNKSKLGGNVSSAVFSLGVLILVLPFAIRGIDGSLGSANWKMAIAAALCGGIGLLFFNAMLAKATAEETSTLFVVMILVQATVPVLYQIYLTRSMPPARGVGFVMAFIAAVLLLKK